MNQLAHDLVRPCLNQEAICLDATCGNGHDTLFLARHAKTVHALDIQPLAIETTRKRATEAGYQNVKIHLLSHDQLVLLFGEKPLFDVIVYNLGYLPHSDHQIITRPDSTVASLMQAISLLKQGGLLTVMVYTGHEGGAEEADAVEAYLATLDKHRYVIQKTSFLNRIQGPYLIALKKLQ